MQYFYLADFIILNTYMYRYAEKYYRNFSQYSVPQINVPKRNYQRNLNINAEYQFSDIELSNWISPKGTLNLCQDVGVFNKTIEDCFQFLNFYILFRILINDISIMIIILYVPFNKEIPLIFYLYYFSKISNSAASVFK